MVYFDSSALIKRYVLETGSDLVDRIVARHKPQGTTRLTYVEVHAAFARRKRERLLSAADYNKIVREFETDFEAFGRIEVRAEIVNSAKDLSIQHGLKTLDSIHLASALRFGKQIGKPIMFVSADQQLLKAAHTAGLRIIDAEHPETVMEKESG